MTYTCKETLFSHKNEGTPMACNNMNEPEGHYANWNMPVSKGQLLHDFTYEISKNKSNDCQRLRGGVIGKLLIKEHQVAVKWDK